MRHEPACFPHFYLTVDLWVNRNISSFLGNTVRFVEAEWKLCSFILAADSFLERHTAYNIAKTYNDVIEKFELTSKVAKCVSVNASSMVKALQVFLPQFVLHKSDNEVDGCDKEQLLADSVSEHDFVENDTDLNSLLSRLPERVSYPAHTKQICIRDCLQNSLFLKAYIRKKLAKVAKIVHFNA